jgi:hypothetical protein
MTRLPADAPVWQRAPWNDPALCPTCGKPATEVVGGRRYSADCARAMRVFLASFVERQAASDASALEVQP